MQVGASALHSPLGEEPSPLHSRSVVLDNPNPVRQKNEHKLPWLTPSSQCGPFPLSGADRDEQVIAIDREEQATY